MKFVYVATAYSADPHMWHKIASLACLCVLRTGAIPLASHVFYGKWLDDKDPEDRKMAMEASKMLVDMADAFICIDDGTPSEGRGAELKQAGGRGIPILRLEMEDADWGAVAEEFIRGLE